MTTPGDVSSSHREAMQPTPARSAGLFIDAGYLTRALVGFAFGQRLDLDQIRIDADPFMDTLTHLVSQQYGSDLQQVSWFDGRRSDRGDTRVCRAMAAHDKTRMVYGAMRFAGGSWRQKRVDALIHRDLVNASLAGLFDDLILFAGDEDLAVGVEQAREMSATPVHVWGFADDTSWSPHLQVCGTDSHGVDPNLFTPVIHRAS